METAMTGLPSYSTTPAENVSANTGINWDEGMPPATVNNSARQNMTDVRLQWNDASWFQYGVGSKTVAATYSSGTVFTLAGADATAYWHVGRRVRGVGSSTGTIYGTITATAFAAATNTVTVRWDSGALANEALAVSASIMPMTGSPLPSTPTFAAYGASTQSVSTGVATKVTLGTELIDTNANFASNRFTPTLSGYYQVNAVLRAAVSSGNLEAFVSIYKNGAEYRRGDYTGTDGALAAANLSVADIIFLNGSTDYIELFGYVAGTGPEFNFVSAAVTSTMSGTYLHP